MLIVGEPTDPHVAQVVDAVRSRGAMPFVISLDTVQRGHLTILPSGAMTCTTSAGSYSTGTFSSAWLRRLHSPAWGHGLVAGDLESIEAAAWHSAFVGALQLGNADWVSHPVHLRAAESKLVQMMTARQLGVRYPATMVTSDAEAVREAFRDDVVVKPIGAAQFRVGGETRTVLATKMKPSDPELSALEHAPFIVQEFLLALRHLRVVTVGEAVWASELQVTPSMPTDWRASAANHHAFRALARVPHAVAGGAVRVADELRLGYTSQDWIETEDGFYLLDVNPSGQWLFLPQTLSNQITEALAVRLLEQA